MIDAPDSPLQYTYTRLQKWVHWKDRNRKASPFRFAPAFGTKFINHEFIYLCTNIYVLTTCLLAKGNFQVN